MSLNDPFEGLCLIDIGDETIKQEAELHDGLQAIWDKSEESEKNEENLKLLQNTKKKLLDDLHKKFYPSNLGKEFMSDYGDKIGVLSLSRTKKSLLMWSHYASEGKGIVIAFDEKNTFFRQHDKDGNETRPRVVTYSSKRPKVRIDDENMYEMLLCQKPLEWAYEQEERVFRLFENNDYSVGKDQYDKNILLYELPPESIKGVYVGYRASIETRSRVIFALHKNRVSCPIYSSSICDEAYDIKFNALINTTS